MLITDKKQMEPFLPHTRVWQGIPSIEKTKGGRLFATFYSGDVKETAGNYCVLAMSDDDGKTWIDPVAVAFLNYDTDRCYDPCLWIDPLHRLWFWWAEHGKARRVMAAICENPDADELVWSVSFEVGGEVMMNKPIVLSTGEWLFPSAIWEPSLWIGPSQLMEAEDPSHGSKVYISRDNGKTITALGGADIPFRSYDEHMVLEKNDGTIEMFVRTRYGIGKSISYDRGHSWCDGIDSRLGGPSSRFHIRRLKSGNILLVNHYNYTGRNNLTALLSDDDGKTFRWKLLLDARHEVSYPDATEDDDGNIYIIYDRERGAFKSSLAEANAAAREVLMVKLTEADIMAENADAVSPVIISKLGDYSGKIDPYNTISGMSDDAFCQLLLDAPDTNAMLQKLFDRYSVSCADLCTLDLEALDKAITALVTGEDKPETLEKIISILSANKASSATCDSIFSRMLEYLTQNLTREFTLEEMAHALSASKFYLCHVFKEKTGTTVYRYIRRQRMAKAKGLLIDSNLSITEIAAACGYEEHSYFTKLFRISEGMTPTEYREKHT